MPRLHDDFDPEGDDLTVEELADRLGKSVATIRRRLRRHLYPGAVFDGQWRIPQQSVIDYISLRTIPPTSTPSPE